MDEVAGTTPQNRFERRRQQNREGLIDSALELFQARGIRETKLEEICEHADVAPRTFFNHFETRQHLYQAIAERRANQLANTIDSAASSEGAVADRLRELFTRLGRYLEARPRYRELVGEMLNLRADGGSEIARDRTLGRAARRFVSAGVTRGEIGDRHPPEILADLMLGTLTTALTNWCSNDAYELVPALAASADVLADVFSATRTPSGGASAPLPETP